MPDSPRFAVILPAAGQSSRFGGLEKKPFVPLEGRPVWLRAAEKFTNRPEVRQILVTVAEEDEDLFQSRYGASAMFMNITPVRGGASRDESVANALAALDADIDYVAIHDAVRPCVTNAAIDAVFHAAIEHGAAILAVPLADTLKRATSQGMIGGTVSREGLWRAQTPQVFRRDLLLRARASAPAGLTDDAQVVELLGHPVRLVLDSAMNLKVTTRDDLELAAQILRSREVKDVPKPRHPFDDE